jgi:hypothetical protein
MTTYARRRTRSRAFPLRIALAQAFTKCTRAPSDPYNDLWAEHSLGLPPHLRPDFFADWTVVPAGLGQQANHPSGEVAAMQQAGVRVSSPCAQGVARGLPKRRFGRQ